MSKDDTKVKASGNQSKPDSKKEIKKKTSKILVDFIQQNLCYNFFKFWYLFAKQIESIH